MSGEPDKCGPPMLDPVVSPLLGPLFSSPAMRARLADGARLQHMLDVEAALAEAEAAAGDRRHRGGLPGQSL